MLFRSGSEYAVAKNNGGMGQKGQGMNGFTRPTNEGMTQPADAGMTKPTNEGQTKPTAGQAPMEQPQQGTNQSTAAVPSGNQPVATTTSTTEDESVSQKGLKAGVLITINE